MLIKLQLLDGNHYATLLQTILATLLSSILVSTRGLTQPCVLSNKGHTGTCNIASFRALKCESKKGKPNSQLLRYTKEII